MSIKTLTSPQLNCINGVLVVQESASRLCVRLTVVKYPTNSTVIGLESDDGASTGRQQSTS